MAKKVDTELLTMSVDAIRGADPYEKARMEAAGWDVNDPVTKSDEGDSK